MICKNQYCFKNKRLKMKQCVNDITVTVTYIRNGSCSHCSEGRDVFPCDFRAKIDFFALNDCLCAIIMKHDGVQFFRLLEPILRALFLGHAHFCA